ncbi:MAG: hypothetical protein GF387_00480 [Candidatus Portnoybacteria bacterium]|nr:hypothetical protein [Candidatus Portnoybacteria bacterium]
MEQKTICDKCGKEYNQIYRISDNPNVEIVFEGSGCFYKGKELCDECCREVAKNKS